jgi:excisionase family DNA binding protein
MEGGPAVKKTARQVARQNQYVFRVGEVARRLGCSDVHVIDLIEEGKIEAIDVGSGGRKYWRVPREALERYQVRNNSLSSNAAGKKP